MTDFAENSKSLGKEVARCGLYGIAAYFLMQFLMQQMTEDKTFYQTQSVKQYDLDTKQAAALDKIGDGTLALANEVRGFAKETDDVADAVVALRKTIERQHISE